MKADPEYVVMPFQGRKTDMRWSSFGGKVSCCKGWRGKFSFGINLKFESIQKLDNNKTKGAFFNIVRTRVLS